MCTEGESPVSEVFRGIKKSIACASHSWDNSLSFNSAAQFPAFIGHKSLEHYVANNLLQAMCVI